MKKMFVSALIPLFLLVTINSFAQTGDQSAICAYKIQMRNIVDASDGLSRFIDRVKTQYGVKQWESFVAAAEKGTGYSAFDQFVGKSQDVKNTFVTLTKEMGSKFETLIAALNPDGKLSNAEVKIKMEQTAACYFADTVENNPRRLYSLTGREAPPEIGNEVPGPCEIAFRSCMTSAESTHISQLMACGFGAGGLIRWVGLLWGAISGIACLSGVEYNYNNAKWTCIMNYADCAGHQ